MLFILKQNKYQENASAFWELRIFGVLGNHLFPIGNSHFSGLIKKIETDLQGVKVWVGFLFYCCREDEQRWDCGKAERKTEHVYMYNYMRNRVIRGENWKKKWIIDEENLGRQYDLASILVFLSELNEIMNMNIWHISWFLINVTYY